MNYFFILVEGAADGLVNKEFKLLIIKVCFFAHGLHVNIKLFDGAMNTSAVKAEYFSKFRDVAEVGLEFPFEKFFFELFFSIFEGKVVGNVEVESWFFELIGDVGF